MMNDYNWKDDSGNEVHVYIDSYYITQVNSIILKYINDTYGKFGFKYGEENILFTVGEKIINSKCISFFVNNKKIYNNTIHRENINDGNSFVNYIKSHLKDMYHYDGIYFSQNYTTTKNTAEKGSRGETICLPYFSKMHKERHNENLIISASKIKDDINGVDGTFLYKNKPFTIQVKPFSNFSLINDKIIIRSDGDLKLNAHYLILYKEYLDKKLYDIIILRNGVNKDLITYNLTEYTTSIDNFIKFEKSVTSET
jgi:hypothetical protein